MIWFRKFSKPIHNSKQFCWFVKLLENGDVFWKLRAIMHDVHHFYYHLSKPLMKNKNFTLLQKPTNLRPQKFSNFH